MRFIFNKVTLFSNFLSLCLTVIGYIFQTLLFPLQDINISITMIDQQ